MASNSEIAVRRKTLTRSVSASSMIPANRGQTPQVALRDYTLNRTKSLEKKNIGCQREHMKCEVKQGNNVVIELSTAAYELVKICLHELFQNPNFSYFPERKDSVELHGANVDTCYKIYNKKSDGSCGKMQKFVINLYHTTSVLLVNGSRTDIFLTDIYEDLCSLMESRCKQLDIINLNIANSLSKETSKKAATISNPIGSSHIDETEPIVIENLTTNNINDHSGEQTLTDNQYEEDVCEICPICHKSAYGKVVQCGECGDWYHYECLNIDDSTIQTLGDDDFICRLCTDNLLTLDTDKSITNNDSQENETDKLKYVDNELAPPHTSAIISEELVTPETMSCNSPQHDLEKTQGFNDKENISKNKGKKVTKLNKMKKEEIVDKSYILELENQVKMLKSTIELQSKVKPSTHSEIPMNHNNTSAREAADFYASPNECRHTCCNSLKEKLQENRIRLLETQMMQNMYIQNAMHIQLVSQMKNHCQIPDPRSAPYPTTAYPQQFAPHQYYQPGPAHMAGPFFTYYPPPTGLPYHTAPPAHLGLNLPRYPAAPPPVHTNQHLGNLQNPFGNNAFPVVPPNHTQTNVDTVWHNRAQHQPHNHQQPTRSASLHTGSVHSSSSQKPVRKPNKDPKVSTRSAAPRVPSGSRQTQPIVISEQEPQSKGSNQLQNTKPTHHIDPSKVQKRYSTSPEPDNEEPIIKKPCIVNHNNLNTECPSPKEQTSILNVEENSDNNVDTRTSSFLSIPPIKHNPPVIIQEIQSDEKRE